MSDDRGQRTEDRGQISEEGAIELSLDLYLIVIASEAKQSMVDGAILDCFVGDASSQ